MAEALAASDDWVQDEPVVITLLADDAFDPNDSFAAAADVGAVPGVHLGGLTIDSVDTDDWFRFELLDTDDLDISIAFTHATGDLNLYVTDDVATVIGSGISVTDDELVSLTGLAAGTYYAHVTGVGGSENTYDLAVEPGVGSTTNLVYVNDGDTTGDVYTNVVGSDLNTGLTPDSPLATLQEVLDSFILDGSYLVLIDTGAYTGGVTIDVDDEGAAWAGSAWDIGSTINAVSYGFELEDADENTFYDLIFSGSSYGLYIHDDGVDPSTDNVIRDNSFVSNSYGVRINQGEYDQIVDNTFSGTGSYGVYALGGTELVITGNTVTGRTTAIRTDSGTDVDVIDNTLSTGQTGIYVYSGSGTDVVDDYGSDSELDALYDACTAGHGEACDDLFWQSPVGSAYEAYGDTCGGRFEPGTVFCTDEL